MAYTTQRAATVGSPTVDVRVNDSRLEVTSPYNTEFVAGARMLGGRWSAPVWAFDARNEAAVRSLCQRVYGTDGISAPDTVSVRVTFAAGVLEDCGPIVCFGRTVAVAFGRDSGAKLGDGVVVESGGFASGGSVKNWTTKVKSDGAVVLLRDIPRGMAEAAQSDEKIQYEIIAEDAPLDNRSALQSEKDRLIERIREIDAQLALPRGNVVQLHGEVA